MHITSYSEVCTIYHEMLLSRKKIFLLDFFSSQGLNLHTMLSVHDKDNP